MDDGSSLGSSGEATSIVGDGRLARDAVTVSTSRLSLRGGSPWWFAVMAGGLGTGVFVSQVEKAMRRQGPDTAMAG